MQTRTDRLAFTGWHRRSSAHPWRRTVQSEDENECWAMLLTAITGGDATVLPSHRDPNRPADRFANAVRS
jgi:hypothetical protein